MISAVLLLISKEKTNTFRDQYKYLCLQPYQKEKNMWKIERMGAIYSSALGIFG
jgi:hypothetical protein